MSVDGHNKLVKIRTFAQDQQTLQGGGQAATDETSIPTDKVGAHLPTPKMATPTATKHTVTVKKKRGKSRKDESSQSKSTSAEPVIISVPSAVPKQISRKTESVANEPKKIPSFHELQKEAEESLAQVAHSTPQTRQTPAQSPKKHDRSFTTTSTVITDNKRTNEGFFAQVSNSVKSWFKDKRKDRKRRLEPKYTLEDTMRRKGVIQKATTKTGALFTADNETLREAIRQRRSQQKHTPEETDLLWSPNTEVGYALLEAPEGSLPARTQNVNITFKKRTSEKPVAGATNDSGWEYSTDEILETTPEEPRRPQVDSREINVEPEIAPIKIITPSVQETVGPTAETPSIPEPETIEVPQPEQTAEQEYEELEPFEPEPEIIPAPAQRLKISPIESGLSFIRGTSNLSETNTNALAIGAASIVATGVIVVVLIQALIGFFAPDPDITQTQIAEAIIDGATIIDVPLQNSVFSEVEQVILQSDALVTSDVTEIRFVYETKEPITPETLFSLLGFSTNPNLNQSITELHLLTIDQVEHALVFTVTDPITVFGSLLAWEGNIATDAQQVFELPPVSASARFVDKTIGQTDVRVLMDGQTEILVYGFLEKDVVLISRNTDTFTRILSGAF